MKKVLGIVMLFLVGGSANAAIISDTIRWDPFDADITYALGFNLGGPLSDITKVDFIVDPCDTSSASATYCVDTFDTLGDLEPVTIAIADLSFILTPNVLALGDPLTYSIEGFILSTALTTDLADGFIDATVSTLLTGANFVDFTLEVTTNPITDPDPGSSSVPEPSIVALFGLGLLGLGFARRRKA